MSVFTWSPNPGVPSNVLAQATEIAHEPTSVLSSDGLRSVGDIIGTTQTNLLPVAMWGSVATDTHQYSGSSYPAGALAMGVMGEDLTPQLGGGKSSAKQAERDAAWLQKNGFDKMVGGKSSPIAMRAQIQAAEQAIAVQSLTDTEIVRRYLAGADWREVGAYLAKHPGKMRTVQTSLREAKQSLKWSSPDEPAAIKQRLVANKAPGLDATLRTKAGPSAQVSLGISRKGEVKRLDVGDLRLNTTLAFVSRLVRDLALTLTPKTTVRVAGKRHPVDETFLSFLSEYVPLKK